MGVQRGQLRHPNFLTRKLTDSILQQRCMYIHIIIMCNNSTQVYWNTTYKLMAQIHYRPLKYKLYYKCSQTCVSRVQLIYTVITSPPILPLVYTQVKAIGFSTYTSIDQGCSSGAMTLHLAPTMYNPSAKTLICSARLGNLNSKLLQQCCYLYSHDRRNMVGVLSVSSELLRSRAQRATNIIARGICSAGVTANPVLPHTGPPGPGTDPLAESIPRNESASIFDPSQDHIR